MCAAMLPILTAYVCCRTCVSQSLGKLTVNLTSSLTRLAALASIAAVATPSLPATAKEVGILSLESGRSIVVQAPGLTRLAIGDGKVAGVVPVGTSAVVVNAKAAGHTTLFIWQGNQEREYEVTVSQQSLSQVARIVRTAIAEPNVQVETFGSNVFVQGTVPDIVAYQRVDAAIARFKDIKYDGTTPTSIINAVVVKQPLGSLQDQISKISDGKGVRVDTDTSGNVVVSGSVRDAQQRQDVLDRVKATAGRFLGADGKIVDRLSTRTSTQVDVKVYVLEVDRTAQSQLGLRLGTAQPASISGNVGGGTFNISPQPSLTAIENPLKATNPFNPFNFGPFARVSLLAPTLDLLLESGHAKLLESPNLVTLPGQAASFLVGGEIPIPVSSGLGTVSIDYKKYGVQLNVTPNITGDGSVESKITPEVSDLDFADGIQLNGFIVPAFKTSTISTDVVTQSGESIIMGGLVRRIEQKNIQKFPILGDIPILGQLFRDVSYQKNEQDVVFIMTPTIITK